MPGLNQTGPMGQGSMTGRKMGKCTNFGARKQQSDDTTTQENVPISGRGMGRGLGRCQGGRGMGLGRRNRNGDM
jgi:hypothetical protein